jgi:hypothetical protein
MSCVPDARAVLVWRLWLPAGVRGDWLDDAERRRAASYSHLADRNRFVAGRSLLRAVLAENLCVAPSEVPLVQPPGGPPELTGPAHGLHWSVSHAGPLIAVALARRPVGVAVERGEASRDRVRREALFKAGAPDRGRLKWRVAKLPAGKDHVGSVAAPGLWRLRLTTGNPDLA